MTAVRLLEELEARGASRAGRGRRAARHRGASGRRGSSSARPGRGARCCIDGAHNPAGARALAAYVAEATAGRCRSSFGVMRDKDVDGMLARARAGRAARLSCTAAPRTAPRGSPVELAESRASGAPAHRARSSRRPLTALEPRLAHGPPVVVAGSLYLVGDVIASWHRVSEFLARATAA